MPYIKIKRRLELDKGAIPQTAGELNYMFTRISQRYIATTVRINYQAFNDVVGALESCKLEFYRRLVTEYEEKKIIENSDVYGK